MAQINTISFDIINTKVDSVKKIKKLYKDSLLRKKIFINKYAEALFRNPQLISDIATQIAVEAGYQKAIKELSKNILLFNIGE